MPYLRLYSQDLPIDQKRVIAQKLIEITLRSLHLRPDQRNQITIQFLRRPSGPSEGTLLRFLRTTPTSADVTLEVIGHNLTESVRKVFAEEADSMLAHLLPANRGNRIAHLLSLKRDKPSRLALQFSELNPAVSEPFLATPESWAA